VKVATVPVKGVPAVVASEAPVLDSGASTTFNGEDELSEPPSSVQRTVTLYTPSSA
jgi:hypothetical protein